MVGSAIRHWLDLIIEAETPWGIRKTDLFEESFSHMLSKLPDLRDRLKRFVDIKLPNPLSQHALAGKSDRPFTAILAGYWHCHLAPDAILIYRLKNHCVELLMICQHADLEGRRQKVTQRRLERVV